MVGDDVGGVDAGEKANLIEGRIFFFFCEVGHFNDFDGKKPFFSAFGFYFDDSPERSASQFFYQIVSFHRR